MFIFTFLCILCVADQPPNPNPKGDGPKTPMWQRILTGDDAKKAEQLEKLINDLEAQAKFAEAIASANELMTFRERLQGRDHWQTVDARRRSETLAAVASKPATDLKEWETARVQQANAEGLFAKGRYREAFLLFEQALTVRRKLLGEMHADTATSYNKLALSLHAQGKYEEAELHFRKALELRRKLLGEDHPETATSYNNIAYILDSQGRHAEAEPVSRRALELYCKVLGEEHTDTANCYNSVGVNLNAQGKHAEAEPVFKKALELRRKLLGDDHPDMALSNISMAGNLHAQGRLDEAEPLFRKALELYGKHLGDEHPYTAASYNNVAVNLNAQGKYAEAEPICRRALKLYCKVLGEEHPDTATSYNNLGTNLNAQGKHAEAEPLLRQALELRQRLLGVMHPNTAASYNNVAANLNAQGKHAEAEPLYRKALELYAQLLGEQHPLIATSYNNVATNLDAQGKYIQAEMLHHKALELRRKHLGDEHPHTATSFHNVGSNLQAQDKYAESEPLLRKALELRRKCMGDEHPETAQSFNSVAANLHFQGKHAEAVLLFKKSLELNRKLMGEEHPNTALSYDNVACILYALGRYDEAEEHWSHAAESFEKARINRTIAVLDRALYPRPAPFAPLAALLARKKEMGPAYLRLEQEIGRGLWDEIAARQNRFLSIEESDTRRKLRSRLLHVNQLIEISQEKVKTESYQQEQLKLQAESARFERELAAKYGPFQGQQYSLEQIQEQIPPATALVAWLDIPGEPNAADPNGEHWAVVVRSKHQPNWIRLKGTGQSGNWTNEDGNRAFKLAQALAEGPTAVEPRSLKPMIDRLRQQRIEPVVEALRDNDETPTIRHLIILPSEALTSLPIEVLLTESQAAVPALPRSSLVLDSRGLKESAKSPKESSLSNGTAAAPSASAETAIATTPSNQSYLVSYAPSGNSFAWLRQHRTEAQNRWKDKTKSLLALGDPAFDQNKPQAASKPIDPLPGTRNEVEAIAGMFGEQTENTTILLGSEASEQNLHQLAQSGKLKSFRYLHFATHGVPDSDRPMRSRLLLARDNLPDPLEQVTKGQEVFTGELTVEMVLRDWDLDADLVVLSACESALGRKAGGEGHLGFAQALILAGARSLVLSLWKVNDLATSLLMQRFYQNLLGARPGLSSPLPKAEALHEAKHWLRTLELTRSELEDLLRSAPDSSRGQIVKNLNLPTQASNPQTPTKHRPFAHPFFWAAFILIGDPE